MSKKTKRKSEPKLNKFLSSTIFRTLITILIALTIVGFNWLSSQRNKVPDGARQTADKVLTALTNCDFDSAFNNYPAIYGGASEKFRKNCSKNSFEFKFLRVIRSNKDRSNEEGNKMESIEYSITEKGVTNKVIITLIGNDKDPEWFVFSMMPTTLNGADQPSFAN